MSTSTSGTGSQINFSINRIINGDVVDIPDNQQMVIKGTLIIEADGELKMSATSEIAFTS